MALTAATSSIANLFSSIFTPSSKPPSVAPPPPHLSVESSSKRTPLIQTNELQHQHQQDVLSVVCPSLAYSNTLYCGSTYNVQLVVDDEEPEEKLLGRFRREVMRAGIIQECKRRRYYENKQDKYKRKTREAAKRNRRRRPFVRTDSTDEQAAAAEAAKDNDDENDNWDYAVSGLPY